MDIDTSISTITATFGAFILLYGVCSLVIKQKLYISEACNLSFKPLNLDKLTYSFVLLAVAILCGIACGPIGFNWININDWVYKEDVTRQFSRIVIAIQVMHAGFIVYICINLFW
jgi:NhaP-type Na+/H+ or K+/H+ antiporter